MGNRYEIQDDGLSSAGRSDVTEDSDVMEGTLEGVGACQDRAGHKALDSE